MRRKVTRGNETRRRNKSAMVHGEKEFTAAAKSFSPCKQQRQRIARYEGARNRAHSYVLYRDLFLFFIADKIQITLYKYEYGVTMRNKSVRREKLYLVE